MLMEIQRIAPMVLNRNDCGFSRTMAALPGKFQREETLSRQSCIHVHYADIHRKIGLVFQSILVWPKSEGWWKAEIKI